MHTVSVSDCRGPPWLGRPRPRLADVQETCMNHTVDSHESTRMYRTLLTPLAGASWRGIVVGSGRKTV